MMVLSGTSVSLRYAKASARWRKPVRTADHVSDQSLDIKSEYLTGEKAELLTITVSVFVRVLPCEGFEQSF